ncbi:MAG: hypothetical protein K2Q24_16920 [Chitinophagaceae bacterium]|jgi:hypothetical protein|nr:hypothetical protein [Chitinophagaceae bacterium]
MPITKEFTSATMLSLLFMLTAATTLGQQKDSIPRMVHFGGTITATQNGISLIPSFSLNRPAVLFDLNMGGKKLTFEPFLRFGTNGKPWAFVFWFRYKVATGNKFKMSIGAHPSYVFRNISNPPVPDAVQVSRFAAIDFTPTFIVAKNISVGVYYLTSKGIDKSSVRYTHFITLNANFSHLKIAGKVYAKFNPQVYYLNMAGSDGFYVTHSLTLAHEKFPVSLQTIMNKAIRTEIAGNSFVWNLSAIYSFNKNYVRH